MYEHRKRNTSMGGIINTCEAKGINLKPIMIASGGCSGIVFDETYNEIINEILEGIEDVKDSVDAILLSLHGAMVTESLQSAEYDVLKKIRKIVGKKMPIMVALDLHGNLNEEFVNLTNGVFGYHSSPHVDCHLTGERTANAMINFLSDKTNPIVAFKKANLVIPSVFSATTLHPAKTIIERVHYWMDNEKVIDVSFFFGFAWSDVKQLGASVVAVTDNDDKLASEITIDLVNLSHSLHHELTTGNNIYSVADGVALAIKKANNAKKPIILLDHSDRLNETTFVLRELLKQIATKVAHPLLWDPEAVRKCNEVGKGKKITLEVGSKSSMDGGGPVEVTGEILFVGEKQYIGTGPMRIGSKIDHGLVAILDLDGIWLQITEKSSSLIDADPIIQFGYNLNDFDIIVTKSKTHFRAVYEEAGEEIIIVDAPAYSPVDLSVFEYTNVKTALYPLTTKNIDDIK
jgi:microcystin degradation protein MlrC